jgi:predicted TIM-barrel fold metal-dependent hydrolase
VRRVLIDIGNIRVVDSHCHAFLPQKENRPFEEYFSLSAHPISKEHLVNTFLYRIVISELKRTLKINGSSTQVIEERNKRYYQNPQEYIETLFRDVRIKEMLIDSGFPSEIFSGYDIPLDTFSELVQCRVKEIYRLENLILSFLGRNIFFNGAVDEFNKVLESKIKSGIVSLKSVIAYFTGLSVQKKTEEEARKAYSSIHSNTGDGTDLFRILKSNREQLKIVLDYFLFEAVCCCLKYDVPLQIHVGMGDVPGIDLTSSSPLLLKEFLSDSETMKAKIILTHGGYPYIREAGFLAATHPNVYVDFSETVPFVSVGIGNMLMSLLEMTPVSKIMYGSDCFNVPELAWISAFMAKKELASTLNNILDKWNLDDEWVIDSAAKILAGNAERIYKLTP